MQRAAVTTSLLIAFALAPGRPAPAQTAAPTVPEAPSYAPLTEDLYSGAQPTTAELVDLRGKGLKTVVNLRLPSEYDAEAEKAAVEALGLTYISLPVNSADPREEQVVAFLKLVNDPAIRPALVHCSTANRVAAFWMIHRVLDDGIPVAPAEAEARKVGLTRPSLADFARTYVAAHQAGAPEPAATPAPATE